MKDEHGVQKPTRSWILCWTLRSTETHEATKDFWRPFETYAEAKKKYDQLYHNEKVYSRSLCAVMESSDYETHEAFKMEATA